MISPFVGRIIIRIIQFVFQSIWQVIQFLISLLVRFFKMLFLMKILDGENRKLFILVVFVIAIVNAVLFNKLLRTKDLLNDLLDIVIWIQIFAFLLALPIALIKYKNYDYSYRYLRMAMLLIIIFQAFIMLGNIILIFYNIIGWKYR